MTDATPAPKIVTIDEGEEVTPFGIRMRVMLSKEETGGTFSALVCHHQPGEGPPPHYHTEQDEYFYVLTGAYEMTLAGETQICGPGTMVYIPRGTVHSFRNNGDEAASHLDWTLPGGQETYFREITEATRDAGESGFGEEVMAKIGEINRRHDTHFPG
jgi:quercetin dioxygenase-like cupin family protein